MTSRWRVLLVLTCAASAPVCAFTLYRGDHRPPGHVFFNGLAPEGGNLNVLDHLSGASCNVPGQPSELRSGFLSLTTIEADAQYNGLYVYHVTPDVGAPETTAAFSVMSGLRFLYDRRQMYGLTLLQSDATSGLMSLYEDASVHITQGVPGTWIRAVDIYRWDERTGQRILVTTENNPRYRAPRDAGGQGLFTANMIRAITTPPPPTEVLYMRTPGGREMPVCLTGSSECSHGDNPAPFAMTHGPLQCASKPAFSPSKPFGQALYLLME